jgi:DNA-binding CsgD family transcriptional regulator
MARRQATGCRERATKTIARRLGLAVGTVEVAGIYRVLGAHSRVEATARAVARMCSRYSLPAAARWWVR